MLTRVRKQLYCISRPNLTSHTYVSKKNIQTTSLEMYQHHRTSGLKMSSSSQLGPQRHQLLKPSAIYFHLSQGNFQHKHKLMLSLCWGPETHVFVYRPASASSALALKPFRVERNKTGESVWKTPWSSEACRVIWFEDHKSICSSFRHWFTFPGVKRPKLTP